MTDSAAVLFAGFGLRLALGLAASLYLLPADEVSPRFYRTHFLIILGLLTGCSILTWSQVDGWARAAFCVSIVIAYAGSVVWSLEGAPFGRLMMLDITVLLTYLSGVTTIMAQPGSVAELGSSAAVLGLALSAMLMGHSYLIAPAMSMTPLNRLLIGLFVAVAFRILLSGFMFSTMEQPIANLPVDAVIWLALRWFVGFGGTLAMGWLAWRCARIRSTQSATGILYVVVLFAFIGELISQLLRQSGYPG